MTMPDSSNTPAVMQGQALRAVGAVLRNSAVVEFVRNSVQAGYRECFGEESDRACGMAKEALAKLAQSQQDGIDTVGLERVSSELLKETFRKKDVSFWFNRVYHRYKTETKPEMDFQQLQKLLPGKRVLDYGCGSGYFAARLAKGGYKVFTTDVLDYRYEEARRLPFIQMASATDIAYPDDSVDVALAQVVLHHINPNDLPLVLQRLRKIARFLLIKEDTYGLPQNTEGLAEVLKAQPLLRSFVGMSVDEQRQALTLIDFFANGIAQGLPEMDMPFEFKTVGEWEDVLRRNGFRVSRTVLAGFEPGRMHKSCHVWLRCERTV
jgi:SAM-dependent methyltransferase